MWVRLAPLDRMVPSPKFHEYEYGDVPPDVVAVNETGLPTVGLALTVKLTARASGEIVTVAEADALALLASVAVTLIVSVPFTL